MVEVTKADREAAADVWRDYVARPGEVLVERDMRAGKLDGGLDVLFAAHRQQTVEQIVAWLDDVANAKEHAAWQALPYSRLKRDMQAGVMALRGAIAGIKNSNPFAIRSGAPFGGSDHER